MLTELYEDYSVAAIEKSLKKSRRQRRESGRKE